jgi:drug/metabolite transporter (DMT)-like permease
VTSRRAYAILFVVVLVWAGNFPLSKLGLVEIGPLTVGAARALIAVPLLALVARAGAPLRWPLRATDYTVFVVLGLTGLVLNTTVWYWGIQHTTALNAGIIGAAAPIFTAVAASALLHDRLTRRNWAGIGLSVMAVIVTVAKGSLAVLLELDVNRGDVIILLSQVAWIVYTLYSRAALSTLPAAWVMAGAHVVSAAVLMPLALALEAPWPAPWTAPRGWVVIVYGAVPVTLGHLWFYAIVRIVGASRAATFMNLMPFVVIALAWAIAGETVHAYHLVGAALVVAGVYLVTR